MQLQSNTTCRIKYKIHFHIATIYKEKYQLYNVAVWSTVELFKGIFKLLRTWGQ